MVMQTQAHGSLKYVRRWFSLILAFVLSAQVLFLSGCFNKDDTLDVEMRDLLVVEAGTSSISADQFVLTDLPDEITALFVGSLDHVDLNTPGDYPLEIAVQDNLYDCVLRVIPVDANLSVEPGDADNSRPGGTEEPAESGAAAGSDEGVDLGDLSRSQSDRARLRDMLNAGVVTYDETAEATTGQTETDETGTDSTTQGRSNSTPQVTTPRPTATPYEPRGSAGSATLDALCDGILPSLINNDMSTYQIARAVYGFARTFPYAAGQSPYYATGAEYGLKYRRGNCYTQAFVAEALMRRAGVNATHAREFEGRHAWAMVGDMVVDPNNGVFWQSLSSLQNVIARGRFYMYRTTESAPPPENAQRFEHRIVYTDEKVVPFKTVYVLSENPDRLFSEAVVITEGVNGASRDQWNHAYQNDVRVPSRDYKAIDDEIYLEPVNKVIERGKLKSVNKVVIPSGDPIYETTTDPALDGVIKQEGSAGYTSTSVWVTGINPDTGAMVTEEIVIETVDPIPTIVYAYSEGTVPTPTPGPSETLPSETAEPSTLPSSSEPAASTAAPANRVAI